MGGSFAWVVVGFRGTLEGLPWVCSPWRVERMKTGPRGKDGWGNEGKGGVASCRVPRMAQRNLGHAGAIGDPENSTEHVMRDLLGGACADEETKTREARVVDHTEKGENDTTYEMVGRERVRNDTKRSVIRKALGGKNKFSMDEAVEIKNQWLSRFRSSKVVTKPARRKEAAAELAWLISRCAKLRFLGFVREIFEESERAIGYGSGPEDEQIYCAAMRACISRGDVTEAMAIWNRAESVGLRFSSRSYSVVVSGLARHNHLEMANQMRRELKEGRLELFAYHALLEAFSRIGETEEVEKLFNEFKTVGYHSGDFAQAQIIRCVLVKYGNLSMAFEEMERRKFPLTVGLSDALLEECLRMRKLHGASEVLQAMIECGISTHLRTFNAVMSFFADCGDMTGVQRTFDALISAGLVPNANTYFEYVRTAIFSGESILEAVTLLEEPLAGEVESHYPLWNARLMIAAFVGGDLDREFSDMRKCGVSADESTLKWILKTLFVVLQRKSHFPSDRVVELARSAIQLIESHFSIMPTRESFHLYFHILREVSEPHMAEEALATMWTRSRADPSARPTGETYAHVMNIYVDRDLMSKAVRKFMELEARKLDMTPEVFEPLIRGFGSRLQLDKALGVWEEMKSRKTVPTKSTYDAIVNACLTHPRGIAHAARFIEEMRSNGVPIGEEYFESLIEGSARAAGLKKVIDLLRESQSTGIEIHEECLGALLNACEKNREGEMPSMEQLMSLLQRCGVRPAPSLLEYFSNAGRELKPREKSKLAAKAVVVVPKTGAQDSIARLRDSTERNQYDHFQPLFTGTSSNSRNITRPLQSSQEGSRPEPPKSCSKGFAVLTVDRTMLRRKSMDRTPYTPTFRSGRMTQYPALERPKKATM
mmetsp:Transcript_4158/g.8008  ORF Transcript_4158/g.8008 Transcript_4158/m.8008 type:complete len:883 (-) Transcript_4158:1951-4599(-)